MACILYSHRLMVIQLLHNFLKLRLVTEIIGIFPFRNDIGTFKTNLQHSFYF